MRQHFDISVIIASHRPSMAGDLVSLLMHQKHTVPFDVEIIMITDYHHQTLQSFYPECLWFYIPDLSISRKRNCGVQSASGAVCAFIDDDCLPSDNWLAEGFSYLQNHPETTAVEGKTTIEKLPGRPDAVTREYRRLEKPGFRTNNLFFRTAELRSLGGFDERFTVQREDMDLAFTALSHGKTYSFHPDLQVTHRYRRHEPWDLLKNCWNRRFDPLLYSKHPVLYRRHIGSPLTPTAGITGILHLLLTIAIPRRRLFTIALAADLAAAAGIGIRRSGFPPAGPLHLIVESVQGILAPFVTLTALVYGSIRFKKLLLA